VFRLKKIRIRVRVAHWSWRVRVAMWADISVCIRLYLQWECGCELCEAKVQYSIEILAAYVTPCCE